MTKEKKSFSETRFYPIFFMIIVSLFFGTLLSVFYHSTAERIATTSELRFKGTVLSLFSLPLDDIESSYAEHITEQYIDDYKYYEATKNEELIGYSFEVSGSGLWGTIVALVALNPSLEKIIALQILEQNETPGLGGRIAEDDFLDQFSDKEIVRDGEVIKYQLIPEENVAGDTEIRQITGATSSSNAMVDILYREVKMIIENWEGDL